MKDVILFLKINLFIYFFLSLWEMKDNDKEKKRVHFFHFPGADCMLKISLQLLFPGFPKWQE